jgi:hypothetical protein
LCEFFFLLAYTFSKDEVFTEALKTLYGANHENQASEKGGTSDKSGNGEDHKQQRSVTSDGKGELILPQFCDMAQYVAEGATIRMQSAATRHVSGNHTLPFNPATFVEVRYFCLSDGKSFLLFTLNKMDS